MQRPYGGPKQASIEPEYSKSQRLGIGSRDAISVLHYLTAFFFKHQNILVTKHRQRENIVQ